MLDFMIIAQKMTKDGLTFYPKFVSKKTKDLIIRGKNFYAMWDDENKLWTRDWQEAIALIDNEIYKYVDEYCKKTGLSIKPNVEYLWDTENGRINHWIKYTTQQMADTLPRHNLDEKIVFLSTETCREDYVSIKLPYDLDEGDTPCWDEMTGTLYDTENLDKIEWSIGAIFVGDSKKIEKFDVFYGAPGTGKSTIMKIIENMFAGHVGVFDAGSLGSSSNQFSLETFKGNPLVAICQDGDLSRIEQNQRINSVVSHETLVINEKGKAQYPMRINSFLFVGTNKPVKITDAKSGLLRRVIDIRPTGKKINNARYNELMEGIKFEYGKIASKCIKKYLEMGKNYYGGYVPVLMLDESNDFYNFIVDNYNVFKEQDGCTLKQAWDMYKVYISDAKLNYPLTKTQFKRELRNYFENFDDRTRLDNGEQVWSYYSGFKSDLLSGDRVNTSAEVKKTQKVEPATDTWLNFKFEDNSILDNVLKDCPAQLTNESGTPMTSWKKVTTTLKDINTKELHYVKVPEQLIVIDFDIKDEKGNKSFEANVAEAAKFPPTYAELSKSGGGIHLHYYYTGDIKKLSRVYGPDIEIKVFVGDSSLRRKLTKCVNLPIATMSSGLPMREETKKMAVPTTLTQKKLVELIQRNLNKEIHASTKPSVDFIKKLLDDAYDSGISYNVEYLKPQIRAFAMSSTHQSDICLKTFMSMKFKSKDSDDSSLTKDYMEKPIIFFDIEVFPNLFLINWKYRGAKQKMVRMINPSPQEVERFVSLGRLVGFNNRGYDNHLIYARIIGYTIEQLYELSKNIIKYGKGKFLEAYNLSYTDIYDYAKTKQSLKKWEIQLHLHHQENGYDWDKPVPENKWIEIAEYCDNDVLATEAVFEETQQDFNARLILASAAQSLCPTKRSTANTPTNTLTANIIFRGNEDHINDFIYTNLKTGERSDGTKDPLCFPEYEFSIENGVKTSRYLTPLYKDTFYEILGEGGRVISFPGMYYNVWVFDVASMHPASIIAMQIFGKIYTANFAELRTARIYVKHRAYEAAKKVLNGALAPYIKDNMTDDELDALSGALKIAINAVYGLTSANFASPFKDPRNIDNIVAKRGALFISMLMEKVIAAGGVVVHIKTDSIKVADPTPEIKDLIINTGKKWGYEFEVEEVYERICLVNGSTYIARYADVPENKPKYRGKWTATGTEFAIPYIFKKGFTKEPIEFRDLCETKEVKDSAIYLDCNENISEEDIQNARVWETLKSLRTKIAKNPNAKITNGERALLEENADISNEDVEININKGHKYKFIGKVGLFTPIEPGYNGGLMVKKMNKFSDVVTMDAVTGTSGYRWLESEIVEGTELENHIDMNYFNNELNESINKINMFGDYYQFIDLDITMPNPKRTLLEWMKVQIGNKFTGRDYNNNKIKFVGVDENKLPIFIPIDADPSEYEYPRED